MKFPAPGTILALSANLLLQVLPVPLHAQQNGHENRGFLYPREMRIYDSVMAARVPELKMPPEYLKRSLPSSLDNSQFIFFPGILDQNMYFTCQQYAGVAYTYAYEINRARNRLAMIPENRYPTQYSWNFMNDGNPQKGVSFFYSWDLIRQQGHPTLDDYGDEVLKGFTGWMTGYDKYHRGMHNRLKGIFSIPVNTEEGLLILKNYLFDHLDGSSTGGVACFSASSHFVTGSMEKIPPGTPEEGKDILIAFFPIATHGMTIVGYNDSIRYDLNGDGQFTNDMDITGDGEVDLKDWEIGAYRIANSYGAWWSDQGFFYAMYRALALDYDNGTGSWIPANGVWNHSVYVVEPDPDYVPLLTAKVNMSHNLRDRIRIKAGIASDTGKLIPERILELPSFAFQGGEYPMLGLDSVSSPEEIEFGLDLTPLLSFVTPGQPVRLFLIAEEKDPEHEGHGTIHSVSFYGYASGTEEFPSHQTEIPVRDNDVTFVSATAAIQFDKVHITSSGLPPFIPGQTLQIQMQAAGGKDPYSWSLNRQYNRFSTDSVFPLVTQQVLHPVSTEIPYAKVVLPFSFPFYGKKYDTLYVNGYGFVSFDPQMLPYPYLTDEEGMIRRNRVISPSFAIDFQVIPQNSQIWMESTPQRVTFRWKLPLTDQSVQSDNNFALRLYPGGEFEFLYGDISNEEITHTTYSGYSLGDEKNYMTWANWDSGELSGTSLSFMPVPYPGSIGITPGGLLSVASMDTNILYTVPVTVTDASGISSTKEFELSTGLQVIHELVTEGDKLHFGIPAALRLAVTNNGPAVLQNLTFHLVCPDTSLSVSDSLEILSLLDPGATVVLEDAFHFELSRVVPDQYPVDFRIRVNGSGHEWNKDFVLQVSAPVLSASTPVLFDGYDGFLDPGEVADLRFEVLNSGSLEIRGLNILLIPQDSLVTLISPSPVEADTIPPGIARSVSFRLQASKSVTPGTFSSLKIRLQDPLYYDLEIPVQLRIGKVPVALISLSNVSGSPAIMQNLLDSLQANYTMLDSLPPDLIDYGTVFLILGTTSPGSHGLSQEEGQLLADYLTMNGNLYMESYSTWYMASKTPVHPFFRYTSEQVPFYTFTRSRGIPGTFAESMDFPYTGNWNIALFDFLPVPPAYAVFADSLGNNLEIAFDGEDYRTIGTFVEFGMLADGSSPSAKGTLMERYLDFFNVNRTSLHALFHSDKNTVCRWGSVAFQDDSFENVISWQWEFPGGDPPGSAEQNPVVGYDSQGSFDVKLTVSDGVNSKTILKKGFIQVVSCLGWNEHNNPTLFKVYPNPTNSNLTIEFSSQLQETITLKLFALNGANCLSKSFNYLNDSKKFLVDISKLQKGFYLLLIQSGTDFQTKKIIIY
jgi:hypothetical protein